MLNKFYPIITVVGLLGAIPVFFILFFVFTTPITSSGTVYLLASIVMVIGIISKILRKKNYKILLGVGAVTWLIFAFFRIAFPLKSQSLMLTNQPENGSPYFLNRLFDEQDILLFGARFAQITGLISQRESTDLVPALYEASEAIKKQGGTSLSPMMKTYAMLQSPRSFDMIVSPGGKDNQSAIIFLHGFGGNTTLKCWIISQAAGRNGMMTVCPSIGFIGDWWSESGETTVSETIKYLHTNGIKKIYLAGLSNGGVGTSLLSTKFRKDLAGLIFISGSDPEGSNIDLPVLMIQGDKDERMPAPMMKEYANRVSKNSRYEELAGDHLVLIKRRKEVEKIISDWLKEQEIK